MSLIPQKEIYFKVYAIKELLHRGGFGLTGLPPPACLFEFNLFRVQDIHINELEGAHVPVEHAHPRSHRRLTNDIDDVSALQEQFRRSWLRNWLRSTTVAHKIIGTFSLRESVS